MTRNGILALLVLFVTSTALAENRPANHCEISVKKLFAAPSSHGMGSVGAVVKVGWIGNGEHIQNVGFYGYSAYTDLGNHEDCLMGPQYGDGAWGFRSYMPNSGIATEWGEYVFWFPVRSGSVVSRCPGYHYSWIGSFFVETNEHTYWVNPNMNSEEHFHIDSNTFSTLTRMAGSYTPVDTRRRELRYYNPLGCE